MGHEQFKILQQKGLDSPCWRHAAVSIDADCATMAHARKQRLAVQLSNCHLQVHAPQGAWGDPTPKNQTQMGIATNLGIGN